jgi:hypothetical protein
MNYRIIADKRLHAVAFVAAVALATCIVIAVVLSVSAQKPLSVQPKLLSVERSQAMSAAVEATQVIATNLARNNGDANVQQAVYAMATEGDAVKLVDPGDSTSADLESTTPVIVTSITGNFTGNGASFPAGSKPPTGDTLTVVTTQSTGQILEWGISNAPVDLSSLGDAQALTLG